MGRIGLIGFFGRVQQLSPIGVGGNLTLLDGRLQKYAECVAEQADYDRDRCDEHIIPTAA